MTTTETWPPRMVRQRVGRFGTWQALTAVPTVLGSLLVVLLAAGALGRWAGLLPLAWAACAALLMTRVAERFTVRVVYGFHQPGPAQTLVLQPAWAAALRVTGTDAGKAELYVQSARVPNAYAAGSRSVAVTARIVEDYQSDRLPEAALVAVLVHELGHHVTGATQSMLLIRWLTAPWRLTTSLLDGLAGRLAARQPRCGQVTVVVAGWALAVVRALHEGQLRVGGVLVVVGLTAVLVPLANAAISRRSEYAADRFAADHGLAVELAAALCVLNDGNRAPRGWSRLLSTHPTSEQRIKAL